MPLTRCGATSSTIDRSCLQTIQPVPPRGSSHDLHRQHPSPTTRLKPLPTGVRQSCDINCRRARERSRTAATRLARGKPRREPPVRADSPPVLVGRSGHRIVLRVRDGSPAPNPGADPSSGPSPHGPDGATNYLLATILIFTLFPLLGIDGLDDQPAVTGLVLGIIAVETVTSRLSLNRFRFGPAEWVWRCATWWEVVPIRR
ncbi:MAG: DUF418 domain-containing protein [Rhodococcus sp. (in: high G+C Gram-positive bacteria)]